MKREDVHRQWMFWLNLPYFSNMISFLFFWKQPFPNYFILIFNLIQKARICHARHNNLRSYAHSSPTPIRLHPERNSRLNRHLTFIVLSFRIRLSKTNHRLFHQTMHLLQTKSREIVASTFSRGLTQFTKTLSAIFKFVM